MNLSRCCQGSVDGKTHFVGSRIYWVDKMIKNIARWIEEAVENLLRRNPEILMGWEYVEVSIEAKEGKLDKNESVRDLLRTYQAWRKGVFQGEKNT